ncbi:putative RING finger protein [Wickerhamomyces ciferrii]|uniref:RING finger protein n=1 Tax=Wickerhamomyces ciferrii (strain ATCC 14091 / BCRC 22168 / CBS 111 / JCM 3599 / NBRC 0793 / NRRL Y-1031 F-60-10) TaxID=1206466 RepID=K0KMQ6_WICCF|nr:putative RING finger protein [Wickerhamomyces ciferrii]CCH43492.1 putative RING finger protein [Wickerhamomyces ciferrii]
MKFGKTFEKSMEDHHIPKEWIDSSIHYKLLKKKINKVVEEMDHVGLTHEVINDKHLLYYYTFQEDPKHQILPNLKADEEYGARDDSSINDKMLTLHSDILFFQDLYQQYLSLLKFNKIQSSLILDRIQQLSILIKKLTNGNNKNKNDMYLWREIFNKYVEYKLDLKSQFNSKNLEIFVSNVKENKILKKFKHTKQNTEYFQTFYDLNLELLKFLSFENLNTIAIRKIVKKFDKNTLLNSSKNFNKMIVFEKSSLSTSTIEQVISTDIVKLVPQLDDYLCPICFTIAYKPIRLQCNHFFCIRCMIKLQRRNEPKCPICRDKVVMFATEANLDYELMKFLKENFPKEVKQKQNQNEKEVTEETLSQLYENEKFGLAAFDDNKIKQYSELGQSLYDKKIKELTTQLQLFKSILLNFLKEHNEELSHDLKLRNEFIQICKTVGIDPLQIYNKTDSKMNEFYFELCVRIIEFSNSMQKINGGLLPVKDFLSNFQELGITFKDVEISVNLLSKLNPEFKLIQIGSKFYIKNFNIELTNDQNMVLEAVNNIGYISVSILRDNFGWKLYRSQTILDEMIANGYLWLDIHNGESLYWDPAWINKME